MPVLSRFKVEERTYRCIEVGSGCLVVLVEQRNFRVELDAQSKIYGIQILIYVFFSDKPLILSVLARGYLRELPKSNI